MTPNADRAEPLQRAKDRVILRHHVATWAYRLLPLVAAGLPFALAGGALHPVVAILTAFIAFACVIYAKMKLHGRIDEIRMPAAAGTEASAVPSESVRVRLPGLFAARWRSLPNDAFADAKLRTANIRNAAAAFRLELKTGRDVLRVPLNGAAIDLDALEALSPEAIARYREATRNMRVHYDLTAGR